VTHAQRGSRQDLRVLPIPPQRLLLYAAAAVVVVLIGLRMERSGGSTASYSSPGRSIASPAPAGPTVVVVDVVGAVRRPGVYRLPDGARVQDAVRRAHPTRRANLQGLNLAERLADGEQVVVPGPGEVPVAASAAPGSPQAPVHLNSASLEQLESLDGIGPSLAQRIIDYRTQHGGFQSLDELDQVSGFGPARLAALHGHVAL
jgi:competence protein ComEA